MYQATEQISLCVRYRDKVNGTFDVKKGFLKLVLAYDLHGFALLNIIKENN